MSKRWVEIYFDDCVSCGDAVSILTHSDSDDEFYDGDKVKCFSCGQEGHYSCDNETAGWVSWDDH